MAVVSGDEADPAAQEAIPLPGIPVSAGALIFDRAGRLLILKPTYKSGWTIPGGVMEADGESPWEACRREVREETGIELARGRLAGAGLPPPAPGPAGGIRFLFDCGKVSHKALAGLVLQPEEISESRLAPLSDALDPAQGPDQAAGAGSHPQPAAGLPGGRPPRLGSGRSSTRMSKWTRATSWIRGVVVAWQESR